MIPASLVYLLLLPGNEPAASQQQYSTYYVSPTGSDSNDCLSPALPCKCAQSAVARVPLAATADIVVLPGMHYIGAREGVCPPVNVVYWRGISIHGPKNADGSCVDSENVSFYAIDDDLAMFTVQDGAILIASCFTASSGARNNIVFQGRQFGTLDWQDINFGAVAGGTHISLQDTASGSCTGPYMIGNNAAVHVSATHSNLRLNCAISVPYPLAFTAFMQLMDKAIAYAGAATFSGPGAGSATIGTKYQVSDSTLNLGATLFPGNEIEAPTYGGVIK